VLSLTSELCLLSVSIAEEVGFSAATPVEEGSTESLWAELPPELLAKVLEMLPAVEQSAPPHAGGWRGCKDSAAVRLVCAQWQAVHDALVTKLVLSRETTDEAVGVLVLRFPAVVSLEFKGSGCSVLTDKGLRAVSSLPALTFLDISCCKMTDEGMRAVSNLPALTSLNISCCEKVTDVGMRAVSNLPALTSLNISCCKMTDEGMRAVSHLPALTSLDISYCFKLTDETLRALSSCNTLISLNLAHCKMTDEGLRAVSRLHALTFPRHQLLRQADGRGPASSEQQLQRT
jgi:hypothetical protein